MKKVYIITELKSEDYHGTYETVISVHNNKENANARRIKLEEENYDYNIMYTVSEYPIIK